MYYCTREGLVRGELFITDKIIFFNPTHGHDDNGDFPPERLVQFEATIDISDIASVQKKRMHNESNKFVGKIEDKKNYMYDFFL